MIQNRERDVARFSRDHEIVYCSVAAFYIPWPQSMCV